MVFQFFDLRGKRGLADVAQGRGLPKMPAIGQRNYVFQFLQGHTIQIIDVIDRFILNNSLDEFQRKRFNAFDRRIPRGLFDGEDHG